MDRERGLAQTGTQLGCHPVVSPQCRVPDERRAVPVALAIFRAGRLQHNNANSPARQKRGSQQPHRTAADDHDRVIGDVPMRVRRHCREVSHPLTVPRQGTRAPVQPGNT